MRDFLKQGARWVNFGCFWAAVLLLLPGCFLDATGLGPNQNLEQGPQPWSSMIMCHVEKKGGRHCPASQAEIDGGIKFSDAAIALAEGRTAPYGVDDTDTGKKNCNGDPEIVEFESPFPQGTSVCLNCNQITSMADAIMTCRARCADFYGTTEEGFLTIDVPPTSETEIHCTNNSRVATNGVFLVNGTTPSCYPDQCSTGGIPTGALDPRATPEPVIWTVLTGTQSGGAAGNDLSRNTPTGEYDSGAVSQQWVTTGDAYVEFSVNGTTQSQFIGFSSVDGCPAPCATDDPHYTSIGFAMLLHSDGRIYITESGLGQEGPDVNTSWGQYTAGERFRITLKYVDDETAHVIYSRVVGACQPGTVCNTVTIFESTAPPSKYPFRVDASIREQGATLTDVRLVRIQ